MVKTTSPPDPERKLDQVSVLDRIGHELTLWPSITHSAWDDAVDNRLAWQAEAQAWTREVSARIHAAETVPADFSQVFRYFVDNVNTIPALDKHPPCRSPWPCCWIEATWPEAPAWTPAESAWRIHPNRPVTEWALLTETEGTGPIDITQFATVFTDEEQARHADAAYAAWGPAGTCGYAPSGGRPIAILDGVICLLWNADGTPMEPISKRIRVTSPETPMVLAPSTASEARGLAVLGRVLYFGFALAHCKNVRIVEATSPMNRAARRRIEREAGKKVPLRRFRVLEITPMGARHTDAATGSDPDQKHARHICRGHFKTFTPEKPLFGRHTGTYWWDMQFRGAAEHGQVDKAYRVIPEKEAPTP